MRSKREARLGSFALGLAGLLHVLTGCIPISAPPSPPTLLVANYGGDGVLGYKNSDSLDGDAPPDTELTGIKTQLDTPLDVAVNGAGQLLVCNSGTDAITVYADAATETGDQVPIRNVSGPQTKLDNVQAIAVDTSRDLLYVCNAGGMSILVFTGTSTAAFSGNVPPTRTITSASLNRALGICLDNADYLYVANYSGGNVLVFPNASTLNGASTPRIITNGMFSTPENLFVDVSDNLFVFDRTTKTLIMFKNASTLNGAAGSSASLTVPGFSGGGAITVDRQDTGYLADFMGNAVYVYDNISTRNGSAPPDRTIKGATTKLDGPVGLDLLER